MSLRASLARFCRRRAEDARRRVIRVHFATTVVHFEILTTPRGVLERRAALKRLDAMLVAEELAASRWRRLTHLLGGA